MEWDFKMPSWDMPELEVNTEPGIGPARCPAVRPGSGVVGVGQKVNGVDCSVDLKLGGLGDFGQSERWKNEARAPVAAPVSGSSKRARTQSNGGQIASCLVDGCKSDLSKCRDYHRRHKVCEVHSKTQIVLVGGQEQRFCQQCSRFHLLGEFDEVKRSCRKRLDGHNRRRRKPQPDPFNSASFFANHQGPRIASYAPTFSTATPSHNWSGIIKMEDDTLATTTTTNQQCSSFFGGQQNLPRAFSISFKDGKKFPFLQGDDTVFSNTQTLDLQTDGIAHVLGSERALSLLSLPMPIVAMDSIPLGQPLVSAIPYSNVRSQALSSVSPTGFSCSGIEDDYGGNILVSDASNAGLHCHDTFHVEGPSNGTSQALPFWQ